MRKKKHHPFYNHAFNRAVGNFLINLPKPNRIHSYLMSCYLISQGVYPSPSAMELDYVDIKRARTADQYINAVISLQRSRTAARNLRKLVKVLTKAVLKQEQNKQIVVDDINKQIAKEAFNRACKFYMTATNTNQKKMRCILKTQDLSSFLDSVSKLNLKFIDTFEYVRIHPVDIAFSYAFLCDY
jgi:hypothetical protein